MNSNEFEIRDWRVVLLVGLVILAWAIHNIFVPAELTPSERDAMTNRISEDRRMYLQNLVNRTEKGINNQTLCEQTVIAGQEYLEKIHVVSATVRPRGLAFSKKVRVKYTAGGKKPRGDKGIRYFRVHHSDMGDASFDYKVFDIPRARYESWW